MSALRHEILAALGEPTRLILVERLSKDGPTALGLLMEGLPMSRQGARKHLEVLQSAEIIVLTRHGREQIAELRPEALDQTRAWMDELASAWRLRLGRLKAFVEAED